MSDADVDALMERVPALFKAMAKDAGYSEAAIRRVTTKFRDAGRRSPPTQAFSSRVAGRPQDAADGNRANRWTLPTDHKFYATKRDAQLVEIRYYLQALCMAGAPSFHDPRAATAFVWLLSHELRPGEYKDPIMLRPIGFAQFMAKPTGIQSGHYVPLARGGRHDVGNTFLMLARSNSLQSDLTFAEFLSLIDDIVKRQIDAGTVIDPNEVPSDALLEEAEGVVAE